jgi:hypothetical protein
MRQLFAPLRPILTGEIVTDYHQIDADGNCLPEAEQDAFACLFEDDDPVQARRPG